MLSIVYAVYHDCNKEERSMEMLKSCLQIGKVYLVSYAKPTMPVQGELVPILTDKRSPIALLHFIHLIKRTIKEIKPDIVLLHDSDCTITIPYIRRVSPNSKIVYDSSEFDMPLENASKINRDNGFLIALKSFMTSFRVTSEKKYMRYVDLVFAANEERANMMTDYFRLKETPLVFDNMHRINCSINYPMCYHKFEQYLTPGKFHVLFAGGIDEERLTFDYLESFLTLDSSYELIVVGSASKVALSKFHDILDKNNANSRVHYLGFVSREELRFLLQKTEASVVVFDKNSYNTLYCASGKLYESLFEGRPILASENPPLKRLCEKHNIGVSNDDYATGIIQLKSNYDAYVKNVELYIDKVEYDKRIDRLATVIKEKLKC